MTGARAVRLLQSSSEPARWEVAIREILPSLTPFVRECVGYVERTGVAVIRRELPRLEVPLIFEFGPPIRITDRALETPLTYSRGFVAGLDDASTLTEHDGYQSGIELTLTPLGARAFFGFPMAELARRVVGLPDVLPKQHEDLAARLAELKSWEERFDLLDEVVSERVALCKTDLRAVGWALRRIDTAAGLVDMRELARELGYSHKHVIELFKDQVGLPPKLVARLSRFERVLRHVRVGNGGTWAEVAAAFGYSDQAHLSRDFRQFAGASPTSTRAREPDGWPMPG